MSDHRGIKTSTVLTNCRWSTIDAYF